MAASLPVSYSVHNCQHHETLRRSFLTICITTFTEIHRRTSPLSIDLKHGFCPMELVYMLKTFQVMSKGILPLDDNVLQLLHVKHQALKGAQYEFFISGEKACVHPVIYEIIN